MQGRSPTSGSADRPPTSSKARVHTEIYFGTGSRVHLFHQISPLLRKTWPICYLAPFIPAPKALQDFESRQYTTLRPRLFHPGTRVPGLCHRTPRGADQFAGPPDTFAPEAVLVQP